MMSQNRQTHFKNLAANCARFLKFGTFCIKKLNVLDLQTLITRKGRVKNSFMLRKSMDWFLYDIGLRHERVK